MCSRAQRKTGLTDFGDPYFRTGLRCLLHSLREDTLLTPIGHIGIHGMIVTQLMNRLYFVEAKKRRPKDYETRLIPPVVICGLPRSGTTFLHRLLCSDPSSQGLPFWELMRPIPLVSQVDRKQMAERALRLRRRLTPEVDSIHHVRSDSPEECMWMLSMAFTSHSFWVAAPVFEYLEWLGVQDRRECYRDFGALLSQLQGRYVGRRLVLKAPSHSGSLSALYQAIPEALVVQISRDPVEVFASLSSLLLASHRAVSEHVDTNRLARANLQLLLTEMKRNLHFREQHHGKVLDLEYHKIMADPIRTARKVYRHFGLNWNNTVESEALNYVKQNPRNRHGRHLYSLSDWGIPKTELLDRFGPLCERFRALAY